MNRRLSIDLKECKNVKTHVSKNVCVSMHSGHREKVKYVFVNSI